MSPVTASLLADWQYELAVEKYGVGDCHYAAVHAKLAIKRYTEAGEIEGLTRTQNLTEKIDHCLSIIAENQYNEALIYLIDSRDYLSDGNYVLGAEKLESTKAYLSAANVTFNTMSSPDTHGLERVESRYAELEELISEGELILADTLLDEATLFIDKDDYIKAKSYLESAEELYAKQGEAEKAESCIELIELIDVALDGFIANGNYLFTEALESRENANCTNQGFYDAEDLLKRAKDFYRSAGHSQGIEDVEYELARIEAAKGVCCAELAEQADDLLLNATRLEFRGMYPEAYDSAIKAKNTISILSERCVEELGQKAVRNLSERCEEKLEEIDLGNKIHGSVVYANALYEKASLLYSKAEFEQAKNAAEEAKKIYLENERYLDIEKCDELFYKIDVSLKRLYEADGYYNQSLGYYEKADYGNAETYLGKAVEIYLGLGMLQKSDECNKTQSDINQGKEKKRQADKYYQEALRSLDERDIENAKGLASMAKEIYGSIGYAEGVAAAENILEEQDPKPPLPWVIPILVLSAIAVVYFWFRSKSQRDEQFLKQKEEETRKSEEEQRRKESEEDLKREEEKKRIFFEREKLKEIIASEKENIYGKEQ